MHSPGQMRQWGSLSSLRKDPSVADQKVSRETVRRIFGFARPYKRQITVFLVLVVGGSALVVVTPLLLQRLVDDGVVPGDRRVIVTLALVVAGLAFVEAVVGLAQRYLSSRIGEGLIYDLRTQVFSHVQRQPVAFFTRAQTGALVTRINTDVIGAQQAFTSTLSGVVSNVVSLVLVAGAMLTLSWPITLAALVLLPVFLVPARYVGRRLSGLTRRSMQLNADLATRSTERFNVAGALLVTLFGRRREEDEQFADRAAQVRDVGVQIAMIGRVFFTALTLVAALATALVYGVGGWLAASGTLTIGTLLALAALLGRLYGPITALANVRVDVMSALVSFERVFEILDLPALVQDPEVPRPVPSGPLAVELRDVTFRYPSADEVSLASLETVSGGDRDGSGPVLHDVSLRAEAGELVALVGPSGAGKTSITALVARLYDPQAGSVTVGGVDVRDVTLEELHDRVGVVTQEAHMFHDTVRANLLYARPDATDAELEDALRDAQVLDLVRSLPRGLDTVVGDRGHRLSGGEKQRLALARLLLKAPSVVVLDEATAHLDSESEAAVQRALDTALEGRTALVIAHRLSTVRGADQIVVVDRGRVVDRGKHAELLARGGLYAELYRTQFADSGRVQDVEPTVEEAAALGR